MNEIKGYDGFVDQNGIFYPVKQIGKNLNNGHYEWAQEYLCERINELTIKQLETMKDIIQKNPIIYLIDYEGFVYYSHNKYYEPILQEPNPRYNGKKATKEQINTLFNMLLMNNENPFNNHLMMDEKQYYIDENINRR